MFERELMINGLKRQKNLLSEILCDLQTTNGKFTASWDGCDRRVQGVAQNLKKLRGISRSYRNSYLEAC